MPTTIVSPTGAHSSRAEPDDASRAPAPKPRTDGTLAPRRGSATLAHMPDLQKRGSYTPRRAREQRAYRLVVGGSVAGVIGIVTLVLAIAGVVSGALPAIALIVAMLCAWGFSRTVSRR